VTELGSDDAPIDLKFMIHAIHAAKIDICGFGNSANVFTDVRYPGRLDNCEGCHLPDTYYPVDSGTTLATTVDAGADVTALTDDRAVTPNTAACSACHDSDVARSHMELNGGSFNAAKNADGTLVTASTESCTVCHASGRVADVKVVHQVPLFTANNPP
jgi:OmcA/MtrC family decaheme c-type cytochrome